MEKEKNDNELSSEILEQMKECAKALRKEKTEDDEEENPWF